MDGTVYFSMFLFKGSDIFTDENQNMAIDGTPFVICHKTQFCQHFFLNSD